MWRSRATAWPPSGRVQRRARARSTSPAKSSRRALSTCTPMTTARCSRPRHGGQGEPGRHHRRDRQLRRQPRAADADERAAAAARPDRRHRADYRYDASPTISPRSTGSRPRSTRPALSAIRPCGSARWPTSTGRPATTRWRRWASGCRRRSTPARSACHRARLAPASHAPPPRSRRWPSCCDRQARSIRRICATKPSTCSTASTRAFAVGRAAGVPVVISHHKTIGRANFGRTARDLAADRGGDAQQEIGLDAYPISPPRPCCARKRIEEASKVMITWSKPHPEQAGRDLADIARDWGVDRATRRSGCSRPARSTG